MIGYLEGEIKNSQKNKVILFANGIGFTVQLSENHNLLIGDKTSLFIHTHLRDDELSLFGFKKPEDLNLFETLIGVSGVGPKTALNIFSMAASENIINAIASSDLNFFTSISGVGKKTAQRIILDLKSKLAKGDIDMEKMEGNSELLDSLVSLGFQKTEVSKIFSQIDSSQTLSAQVKQALKLLNK